MASSRKSPRAQTSIPDDIAAHPKPWCDRRPRECQWPISGSGIDMLTCCNRAPLGSVYCPAHAKLAYQPPSRIRL